MHEYYYYCFILFFFVFILSKGANALVLSKIKEAIGLDQTKGCFTAAAPISSETLWYFASLDIPVYEVDLEFYLFNLLIFCKAYTKCLK